MSMTGRDIVKFIAEYDLYDAPLHMIIPIDSRRSRICFDRIVAKNPANATYTVHSVFLTLEATNECNANA